MAAERPRIGNRIRAAMERKRMNQKQLATAVGHSRSAVNAWINDRAWPQNSLALLEEVLEVSLVNGDRPSPRKARRLDAHEHRVLRALLKDDDEYRDVVLLLERKAELVITDEGQEPDEAPGERERPRPS